ncbi:hypothetical protein [Caulobacter sp.]|uniref:hypothetical protein n=1 Tax=Caulobacter sp. TaxID=78 RepID=UPI002B471F2A|nr:hypothetical protein [Caulobacter sp.]HJV42101.1 hypothetical protein [Caulobacter sp.]
MEISSSSPVAPQPLTQQAAAPQAAPSEGFKNQDRFNELIGKVNNSSGSYSESEQMDAWTALHDMAVSGGLVGMGAENNKLYNESGNSAISQKIKQIGQSYTLAMMAGQQSGGASGAKQAALNFFDKQSASNQDVLFRGRINGSEMSGAKPFADVNSWRDSMLAGIRLDQFIEKSSAGGNQNEKAAANSKLASALKLSEAKTQDASWMQQIADLLGQRDPIEDKVDLSDEARRAVGAPASSNQSPSAQGYESGSIASKRV